MARERFGELLLERRLISREQLDQALAVQKERGTRLGQTLVDLGSLTEDGLAEGLADAFGLPLVNLGAISADWKAIHLVPVAFCEARGLFPFGVETKDGGRALLVAMSDPLDLAARDELKFTTGFEVSPRVATLSSIRAAILRYHHKGRAPAPAAPARPATPPPVPAPKAPESVDDDLSYLLGGAAAPAERPPGSEARLDALVDLLVEKGLFTRAELAERLARRRSG